MGVGWWRHPGASSRGGSRVSATFETAPMCLGQACGALGIEILSDQLNHQQWAFAVDHFEDHFSFASWQLFHNAFRTRADCLIGAVDAGRQQQYDDGICEVHSDVQVFEAEQINAAQGIGVCPAIRAEQAGS